MRLSVVVPVYNVESYLRKCIDSLLNQDLTEDEYEIILVDDGSTDRGGAICDEYASRHPYVFALHQPNGGLSAARNTGIDVARGNYVMFVDSDDYLAPNVLKALVDKVEAEDLDALRFNYLNVNERYEEFEPNKVSKPFMDYRDEICDGPTFLVERLGFGCYAWQFLVRRELLNGCRFSIGIFFEDTDWTPRMLLKASRVTSTDQIVYNYLQRQGSITQSVDEKKKRKAIDDKLFLIDTMKMLMGSANDKRWFEGMIAQLALSVIDDVSTTFYDERKSYLAGLKSRELFPLSTYHATVTAERKIRWANVSPDLSCFLLHLKNSK